MGKCNAGRHGSESGWTRGGDPRPGGWKAGGEPSLGEGRLAGAALPPVPLDGALHPLRMPYHPAMARASWFRFRIARLAKRPARG